VDFQYNLRVAGEGPRSYAGLVEESLVSACRGSAKRLQMISFVQSSRSRSLQLIAKRAFDIVASATLLIVFSPLLLLTAAVIRLGSGGPIFSVKLEYCYGHRTIRTIRFRCSSHFASFNRIGLFLVRSGLDQLPMLLNVLRGEMSVVGPNCYHGVVSMPLSGQQELAFENCPLKPGLIGPASDNRKSGSNLGNVEADLSYIRQWSLLLDVRILIRRMFSWKSYLQATRLPH
jgi:lipopolysaccharide/colanic/teichoic acid biosynthesis glycosyltransferase